MRLKKIPAGTKIIKFINTSDEDCFVYVDRQPFIHIGANCFKIIEAMTFYVGIPMKGFPEMQPYAKKKIEILFK